MPVQIFDHLGDSRYQAHAVPIWPAVDPLAVKLSMVLTRRALSVVNGTRFVPVVQVPDFVYTAPTGVDAGLSSE